MDWYFMRVLVSKEVRRTIHKVRGVIGLRPTKPLTRVIELHPATKRDMQTRPSDDLVPLVKFPSRHRREPQLYIVDPTSRPSSRSRRKGNVDTVSGKAVLRSFDRRIIGYILE